MRSTARIGTKLLLGAVTSLIGALASAQNLRVMGTTTGEGEANFNNGLKVSGNGYVKSRDSTNIYKLSLWRVNESGREHEWAWWHMNTAYGQDSLQLYEYQADSAGVSCSGNTADGAMCNPRLTVAKGGNVGVGVASAAYRLDVAGDVHATGSVRTEGTQGWYSQTYQGGWFMQDTAWVRTYNGKSVWAGGGQLGADGGLTIGYGGGAAPGTGAIIAGNVGIGTSGPAFKLDVRGAIAAGTSDLYFTDTGHNHTGIGNTTGYAAIENAANYGTLMILGRQTATGRKVDVWDSLQVNGRVRATGGTPMYRVTDARCTTGTLTTEATTTCYRCTQLAGVVSCGSVTVTNTLIGRLVDP